MHTNAYWLVYKYNGRPTGLELKTENEKSRRICDTMILCQRNLPRMLDRNSEPLLAPAKANNLDPLMTLSSQPAGTGTRRIDLVPGTFLSLELTITICQHATPPFSGL